MKFPEEAVKVHLYTPRETIVLKGKTKEVQETANKLISTKGVKHGELAKTTI